MKIFWSWQSDTPGNTGRYFVRDALLDAITNLKQPEDIEEPTRAANRETMHLDSDRQGVTGSPGLVDTIKKKIEASRVFVADVTPVSKMPKKKGVKESREKRNMNPNVAIELGYALHALGEERVLLVLNEHYGGREFLPFDLKHLGGPIMYSLAPDAAKEQIEAARGKLRGHFVQHLRGYLNESAAAAQPKVPTVLATTSPAVWFQPGEVLAQFDNQTQYSFDDDKGLYLRVSPSAPLDRPFNTAELYDKARQLGLGLLDRDQAGIAHFNFRGATFLLPVSGSGGPLRAATQVFRNGEIWGVGRDVLVDNKYGKLIPVRLLESAFRLALTRYLEFMESRLKIRPPYTIEFGAAGVSGYSLVIDSNVDNPYEIRDDTLSETFVMTDTSSAAIDGALLKIYETFFRLTGYPRPPNLFGFPTKPIEHSSK